MPTILSTDIRRQMDHYILALADGAPADRPHVLVSLYWIPWTTEAGRPLSGHVAWLWVSGLESAPSVARVLTDSAALAEVLLRPTRPARWAPADAWPVPEAATFEQSSEGPLAFTWRVTAADGTILEARWADPGPPVFATGQSRDDVSSITTLLVCARAASATLDGRALPGEPYPDPIWTPWFGAEQTSCVIGLGETIHLAAETAGQ